MTVSKASSQWSIFQKALQVLDHHKGYARGTLLDIGCGTKPFYEVFKGQTQAYIGMDILSKIARPDVEARADQIDLYGDSLCLPVKTSSVDTVFSSFVIEHIFEYDRFISEVYRVLKKNAHFIMISPLIFEVHEAPHDYFRFTKFALEQIGEKHGFRVVHTAPVGGEILHWGRRISVWMRKILGGLYSDRLVEGLSFLIQKWSLSLDNRIPDDRFVLNYLSVFQKTEQQTDQQGYSMP
ncbi:MAG: class I SAM-dependent methyltransferase [Thermodesulfobacteriota bacterium]|nr:class I SAM-dependent methyltransferase [Thermodesulfobacteriota bacterium]